MGTLDSYMFLVVRGVKSEEEGQSSRGDSLEQRTMCFNNQKGGILRVSFWSVLQKLGGAAKKAGKCAVFLISERNPLE